MCNCLLETLECPGKVLCCCCECACKMLLSFICSIVAVVVVIGLIVYFTVYYHKDNHNTDTEQKLVQRAIRDVANKTLRDYFKAVN